MDKKTVFVKIDEYKKILETINLIKGKIEKAKQEILSLSELRQREEIELNKWKEVLEEVENRVNNISSSLLEPENL